MSEQIISRSSTKSENENAKLDGYEAYESTVETTPTSISNKASWTNKIKKFISPSTSKTGSSQKLNPSDQSPGNEVKLVDSGNRASAGSLLSSMFGLSNKTTENGVESAGNEALQPELQERRSEAVVNRENLSPSDSTGRLNSTEEEFEWVIDPESCQPKQVRKSPAKREEAIKPKPPPTARSHDKLSPRRQSVSSLSRIPFFATNQPISKETDAALISESGLVISSESSRQPEILEKVVDVGASSSLETSRTETSTNISDTQQSASSKLPKPIRSAQSQSSIHSDIQHFDIKKASRKSSLKKSASTFSQPINSISMEPVAALTRSNSRTNSKTSMYPKSIHKQGSVGSISANSKALAPRTEMETSEKQTLATEQNEGKPQEKKTILPEKSPLNTMPSYIPSKYEEKSSLESLELIVGKGIDITSPPPDIATLTAFKDAEGTTDDEFYSVDQLNDMKVGQPKKVDIHAFKLKQQQSQEFSQEQLTQNPKKNENQLELELREIVDVITSHIMEALVPYLKSGDDVKIIASQIISSRLSKELSYILEAQALGSNLFGTSEDIIVPESMRRSLVEQEKYSDFSADSYSALEPTPITKRKSSIPIPSSIPSNDKRKVNAKAPSKADVNSRRYSQQVTGKPATKPVLKSRQVSNVSLKSGAVSSPPDTTPAITLKKSSRRSSEIPSYMRPTLTSQRKVKGVDDDDIPMPSRRPSNIPNKK